MEATQLAGGGASADEEVNATQPPDDADTLESTQPADDGGKACARFVRVAGPQRVAMEAETQFEVLWQHGDRVELGRASSSGPGGPARVVLCVSSAQGISRQHGWLRFDRQRGMEFTVCASAAAAVTFINGQYLAASAPTVVLRHTVTAPRRHRVAATPNHTHKLDAPCSSSARGSSCTPR